jgi:hypothetical protein
MVGSMVDIPQVNYVSYSGGQYGWQKSKLAKWQVGQMANWPNGKLMK